MFLFDMPLEELKVCRLPQSKGPDFHAFWDRMQQRAKEQPLNPAHEPVDYAVPDVAVEKISFEAYDGGRIVGWYITPAERKPRPTLIFFHGYSGNRKRVANYLLWALQGFTCIALDVRGQSGESSDTAYYPGGRGSGWCTPGILDPESYYFTRCYCDAMRALDYAVTRDEVDDTRIGTTGCSQGGGLSLAAACFDSRVRLCMAEVPAFCHFRRTFEITTSAPWTDFIDYFKAHPEHVEPALNTLSYVELNNLTERIQCPALVTVGLQDTIGVPSSIFSAFNRIPHRQKLIEHFPFNTHESQLNIETMIAWARECLLDETRP